MQLNYVDAPGAVPATYTLPASQAFELESVSASFNGAGAGGDFLACLSVYSQDGKLIFRAPADQTLSSGDSAEVSFYPLADQASSSAPAASSSFATCRWSSTNFTFGNTVNYVYPAGNAYSTFFSESGGFAQDNAYGIRLPGDGSGVYTIYGWVWNDSGANWNAIDWKLDLSFWQSGAAPTPYDGYDTRLNYSHVSEGRRNTLAITGAFYNFGTTPTVAVCLLIDNGVFIPGVDTVWPIEGYFLVTRVGDV